MVDQAKAQAGRYRVHVNYMSTALLIKLLMDGNRTFYELAEETGMHHRTVARYCKELARQNLARIVDYAEDSRGRRQCAVYMFGGGTSAQRPKRKTSTERMRNKRKREAQAELLQRLAGKAP